MASLRRRAVRIAASFNKLAKSAPVKPGYVWRSLLMTHSRQVSCCGRGRLRFPVALSVGASTITAGQSVLVAIRQSLRRRGGWWRSDDNNAGVAFKPVHFREQLVESVLVRRCRRQFQHRADVDRVNFINEDQAGALSLLLNKSRTEAPTPTNISTNSEPEMLKTPTSPAIALASKFYLCRGANEQNAFGDAG